MGIMKLFIKKVPGVRGFIATTYAVFTEDGKCAKIFLTKKEAEEFVNQH